MRKLYWARRPFTYNGLDLRRGQIIRLAGTNPQRDEQLVRLGYFAPWDGEKWAEYHGKRAPDTAKGHMCLPEGKLAFISSSERDAYGDYVADLMRSDQPMELPPQAGIDVTNLEMAADPTEPAIDAEEKKLSEVAPLYLEKTVASMKENGDVTLVSLPTPASLAPQTSTPMGSPPKAEVIKPVRPAVDPGIPSTGAELRKWREAWGMSRPAASQHLKVSTEAVKRAEVDAPGRPLGPRMTQAVLDFVQRMSEEKE